MTGLKTSQPEKDFKNKNLDIEKRFKKISLIKVKKKNLWIC